MTILTPELTVPYQRPPLTKEFLRGELDDEELPIEPPDWYAEHGDRRPARRRGRHARPDARTIVLGSGETLSYDACVLATGAEPQPLPVPGATEEWVLLLRSLATARVLRDRAEAASSAIVIGSGFIGCEAAASLAHARARGHARDRRGDPAAAAPRRRGRTPDRRAGSSSTASNSCSARPSSGSASTRSTSPVATRSTAELILMADGRDAARRAGRERAARRRATAGSWSTRTCARPPTASSRRATSRSPSTPPHSRHLAVEHWGEALNMGEIAGRTLAGEEAQWDVAPGFWSTIGEHTLKYVAWGDGFDEARFDDHADGAFTVTYGGDGTTVGVLTHERDEDYERAANGSRPERRCRERAARVRRRPGARRGGADRRLHRRARRPAGRRRSTPTRCCSCSTAAPTRRKHAPAPPRER